ncbi:MAG: hypothetical protein KUG77_15180 [Nannocystaceae bacterium]|nr:hypothetical protein [Nannocystaceae bacterium]
MRRPLRRLALAGALGYLALCVTAGCGAERERNVRAPQAGAKLHYALDVGTSLDGHLRIGTTRKVEGISVPLTQSVECDARLFVVKAEADGSRVIRATFRSVDLDWSVPPETGLSTEAFAKLAATTLKETEMRFTVSARGKVLTLPIGAERSPPELEGLLDTLGRAATLAFVELPASAVTKDHSWLDPATAPGTHRNNARFDGLSRRGKSGVVTANLEVQFVSAVEVRTPSGPRRRQVEGETAVGLSDKGVPLRLYTELRDFDPLRGTAVQEIHGSWNRTDTGDQGTTDVQDIDDPCDADYVGTTPCVNSPAPQP